MVVVIRRSWVQTPGLFRFCISEFLLPHMCELCLFSLHVWVFITSHVQVVFVSPHMWVFITSHVWVVSISPYMCEFSLHWHVWVVSISPLMCEFPSTYICELCHESSGPRPFAGYQKEKNVMTSCSYPLHDVWTKATPLYMWHESFTSN